ncbi:hypothetical protein Droror1_Dr00004887 [Drosera rotundifolia]
MAIGAVVSNRNCFGGSFLASGNACHTSHGLVNRKGQRSGIAERQLGQGTSFYNKFHVLVRSSLASKCSHCLVTLDVRTPKEPFGFHCCWKPSVKLFHEKFCGSNPSKRTIGRGCCSLHTDSYHIRSSLVPSRKLHKSLSLHKKSLKTKHFRHRGTCAFYKSEDYDVTDAGLESLSFPDVPGEVLFGKENAEETSPWWELPKRWVIVLLCFASFLLCNMDRVNMSIAILPMAKQFNWNSTTVGLIQSSFFWGYLLTQIIGGIWADKIGGKRVLGFGVIWWSVATVLTPIAARVGLPFLLIMRAFMGIGEGVAMPAMNNIISKWIPVSERSRALALVYSGMYLGSVTGLAFSPLLIDKFGWPSVFYSFGSLGSIWLAFWLSKAHSSPDEDPDLSRQEKRFILEGSVSKKPVTVIPWKLILSKAPVWALIISHFCHNWGTFIILTWMPTYYNQVLKFNLMESGLFAVLPWLTMALFANIGGWIADTLVTRGYSVTSVRKIMQSIGFLGPALFLSLLSQVKTPALAVLCMACSQGSDAFSQSGLYSNHQDIGPRYSGVLLGLSNTAGVLAGVFGTAATGIILQRGSWDDVFKVAIALYIIGTFVWNFFSTGEKILD